MSSKAKSKITAVAIQGFKSIRDERRFELRPLTVFAGINSAGKSSLMQPLLLMKQTLNEVFDSGCLQLRGPNVSFTSADQLLSKTDHDKHLSEFSISLEVDAEWIVKTTFVQTKDGLEIKDSKWSGPNFNATLTEGMSHESILPFMPGGEVYPTDFQLKVARDRCFLQIRGKSKKYGVPSGNLFFPGTHPMSLVKSLIHVPGHRGHPERTYPFTATGADFPGTFERYAASVINRWKLEDPEKLNQLCEDLHELGLTWKIEARKVNDTEVELLVGRLPKAKRGGRDLVSIADVGFGVSQTVPVLTALQEASPGQIVYLEQPEIHLHLRSQHRLAEMIARAADRGAIVVVETHSPLLLVGIQSAVANGKISSKKVRLHWCDRDEFGYTRIESDDMNKKGQFGRWPVDFDEVILTAEHEYLTATE